MKSPETRWVIPAKTKWGIFCLEGSDQGLARVVFPGTKRKTKIGGNAKAAARRFMSYFKNSKMVFKIDLDLSQCTEFEKEVYRVLRRVPAGTVITYGALAKRAGYPGAARAVGTAMRKNPLPIVIPCHRVIPSQGGLGAYSAGTKWKRLLLEHEKSTSPE